MQKTIRVMFLAAFIVAASTIVSLITEDPWVHTFTVIFHGVMCLIESQKRC